MTLTTVNPALLDTQAQYTGFKNRIINGAMVIDQRNAGASVTGTNYVVDRWQTAYDAGPTVTSQRSTTAPAGFVNSTILTVTASASPSGQATFRQYIEGFNAADFGWGSASAQTVTLSFWVRSSVTGTYAVAFQNAAFNRSYVATYTVSAANTYEYKTVTIAGDTSGTWATDNTSGVRVFFDLGCTTSYNTTAGAWGAGQYFRTSSCVNLIANSGATFYITGVQLEKGSTATSFDYRSYGTELALCQRYYYRLQAAANNQDFGPACAVTTTVGRVSMPFPVTMRNAPSAVEQSGTASNYQCRFANNNTSCSAVPTFSTASVAGSAVNFTVASGLTAGQGGQFGAGPSTGASAFLAWSAEL